MKPVPISSMTADVMPATHDRCLSMGMNDYTNYDQEAQKEFIKIFYDNSLKDLQRLKINCLDFEKRAWIESIHRLKGSSSYLGASILKNLCIMAEIGSSETVEDRQDLYSKIKREHLIICDLLADQGLLELKPQSA